MPVALSRGARALFKAILTNKPAEPPFGEPRFYRELERAGHLTPSGELTEEGEARRWEFLPHPDGPSAEALALFRRHENGDRVEVCDANRSAFRELAAAGLMAACHTFAGGDESMYRLTEKGFERKMEMRTPAKESA